MGASSQADRLSGEPAPRMRSGARRSITALYVAIVRRTVSGPNSANASLNTKMTAWSTAEQACNDITCATAAATQGASYMSAFASEVQAIAMPSDATAATAKVVADATKAAAAFTTLSHATSAAQYQSEATSTGIEQDLTALHTDSNTAATALDNSAP